MPARGNVRVHSSCPTGSLRDSLNSLVWQGTFIEEQQRLGVVRLVELAVRQEDAIKGAASGICEQRVKHYRQWTVVAAWQHQITVSIYGFVGVLAERVAVVGRPGVLLVRCCPSNVETADCTAWLSIVASGPKT